MNVVYAKSTGHYASPTGHTVFIIMGSHWPDNDPMVRAYPDAFSSDPIYGMCYSVPPVVGEAPVTDSSTKDKPNQPTKRVENTSAAPGEKRER